MHEFDLSHVSSTHTPEASSHHGFHTDTNFNLKVINFAAANKSWRLVCNSGNPKSCEAHCSRQFPGDALSIDECTRAVKESFSGSFACFPMNSVVTRKSDGIVALSQIRVGDELLISVDSELKFDRVIGFLHWDEEVEVEFVRIDYGSGVLLIHSDHLLPIRSLKTRDFRYVKASTVAIGDVVRTLWIDGSIVETKVRSVSLKTALGMCCPMTMSGMIIVDSVVCSCYSSPRGLLPMDVGHSTCHAIMAPARMYHENFAKMNDLAPKPVPGIHPYAKALMTAVTGLIFS